MMLAQLWMLLAAGRPETAAMVAVIQAARAFFGLQDGNECCTLSIQQVGRSLLGAGSMLPFMFAASRTRCVQA
eukprot:1138198-Pelagomonas_calceolata.AAC.7